MIWPHFARLDDGVRFAHRRPPMSRMALVQLTEKRRNASVFARLCIGSARRQEWLEVSALQSPLDGAVHLMWLERLPWRRKLD